MNGGTFCKRIAVAFFTLVACAGTTSADSLKITAVLTSSDAVVGETVQLQIQIDSASASVKPPSKIEVAGLQIHYTGESTSMTMRNFSISSSVTYNYTILPEKSGTFKIPPQNIRIGSDNLRTPELTLRVVDSPNGAAAAGSHRTPPQDAASGDDKIAFAELLVPKKIAYVGEMIPVVLRVGFNSRARVSGMDMPQMGGQGFTMQKLGQADRNMENIRGRSYIVYNYKTAISAARAGDFQIGPVEMKAAILVPRRSSGTRRKPFDPFDGNDPFSDPFFMDPFGTMAERHEITIKSEPVSLEVKALPPSAPPTFSGAVGNFSVTSDANPKRVQTGDPITIKATVSGRGNFDRVTAPQLSDDRGWHKYPPSSNFKQDDDVGISGTKSFDLVVSPNEKLPSVPPLVFSYFDPLKEKYVTLQSDAVPVTVEGNAQAAPAVAEATPGASTPTSPPVQQKAQEILHQINQRGKIVRTFAPVYARKEFWLGQMAPFALALGLAGWKIQRARASNRVALRAGQLQQERDELLRKLRRDQLAPSEYFTDASRVVRLKTALKQNIEPATVDAETAARVFNLDTERSERLRRLFLTSDELRYSGASNGAGELSSDRRRETLELIEGLS